MWVLPSCCHGSWVHQSQTLVFRDLTPYIFSSKRWFFQKFFFGIIYLLYHNLLPKLFIIIPYVAHNEWRTFIYLEHFVGIMAPSTWSDSMATPLGSHPGSDANDCVKHLTFSGVYPSWDGNLQTLCLVLEASGRAGLKKRRGWDGYKLVLDFDSPPPKKTCGTKRVYINLSENDSGKDLSHAITRSSWQHSYSIGYIV